MTKEKSNRRVRFLLLIAAMVMLFAMPVQAKAAASKKSLSMNKEYTKYDITNNGKKDTILLTPTGYSYGYYSGLQIKVNGKTAYTVKDKDGVYNFSAQLLTLSNNKTFLYVRGHGDNDDGSNLILQYNKSTGKFKKAVDFESIFSKYGSHIGSKVKSVKGKKIVVNIDIVSRSLGCISFDMTYTYKSGKLKRSSSMSNCKVLFTGEKHNNLTANKNLTVYGSKSLSGKKYIIKKNQKVSISGFYMKGSKFMFKMKVNGKNRWMAFKKKFPKTYLFKEIHYAG